MTLHVAVDIGGTFTDLMAVDAASGEVYVDKAPSSAVDPISAVRGLLAGAELDPTTISRFIHGTTVVTNTLIERTGQRVAFVTNRGFRDVIFIQEGTRPYLYSMEWRKPKPLVARHDCLEVGARIDADGNELAPLDDEDIAAIIAHLSREGIRSVAVGLLFAYINPAHELALADRLKGELPDLSLSLSHQVYPRWRENDRWQSVVANAYLKRDFAAYVSNLSDGLRGSRVSAPMVLMKSNGGVVDAATVSEQPVNYLVSGPVGGVLGAAQFARLAGLGQIMTIDIGGTSSDVSLVAGGEIPRVASFALEHGIPVKAPMVEITTIGAGGGSVGWIDRGGLLRVGPRSAGASPGPACYGRGGTEPTLTDANLLLGRLNGEHFCGGAIALDAGSATRAMQSLAAELGASAEDTAGAMVELATHDMIDALSVISVDRGIDPRDFALVAFGGAGGLHGAEIARGLGMRTVLVPPYPGHTSAFGLLTSGLRADVSQTILTRSDQEELVDVLNAALTPLRERALATLRREGLAASPHLEHRLEMRYYGQNYHREVVLDTAFPLTAGDVRAAIDAFHADYEAFYGYQQATEHVEVVGAIVVAATEGVELTLKPPRRDRRADSWPRRSVAFDGSGYLDTQVVDRDQLAPGTVGAGPLVVEEDLSTTVVPPGAVLQVHESGSLIIELEADR